MKAKRGRPRGLGKEPKTFKDRFQKFYYANRARLNIERRAAYQERKAKGLFVRCGARAYGRLFCKPHRTVKK